MSLSLTQRKSKPGTLTVDEENRSVTLNGKTLPLTTSEFDLLVYLAQNPGKVLPREELYRHVRGISYNGFDRSIDQRIAQLRKKLGDRDGRPGRIVTVWGVGYLFAKDP
ncbi:MAG: winged helix family transcriptional regulator [Myxococcales bacterium]|nr:MAG: winged helix family transcriptional regulator [Myxococcales bacterium]